MMKEAEEEDGDLTESFSIREDDEEEEEDGPPMGAPPKRRGKKGLNPLKEPERERKREQRRKEQEEEQARKEQAAQAQNQEEEEEAQEAQVQDEEEEEVALGQDQEEEEEQEQPNNPPEQSIIPPFGDNSRLVRDWTTTGLFAGPITQREDTCGSIVFTRLLEYSYNRDKPVNQRRNLSHMDLAHHIKSTTGKKTFSYGNSNIPIKYIRNPGIHKDDKVGSVEGTRTKGRFDKLSYATRRDVFDKMDTTPFGIVVENHNRLEEIGADIYDVPPVPTGKVNEHVMLALAKGVTIDGIEFIVVQNSWGVRHGNNGYVRLALPDGGVFKIFWPRPQ